MTLYLVDCLENTLRGVTLTRKLTLLRIDALTLSLVFDRDRSCLQRVSRVNYRHLVRQPSQLDVGLGPVHSDHIVSQLLRRNKQLYDVWPAIFDLIR